MTDGAIDVDHGSEASTPQPVLELVAASAADVLVDGERVENSAIAHHVESVASEGHRA